MAPFRLAHLSDPHLPWDRPRGREVLGKRGFSLVNWMRRRRQEHREEVATALSAHLLSAAPDLIALTGDVINFGLAREFRAAREWFESLASPEKLLVIPGNHEAMAGQWHQAMIDAWGPYAMALPRMTRHDSAGLALIQLSTAIATPVGFASGRLDDLDQSAGLLSEARHAGHFPVVLMHHPPTSITSARRGLSNAADARHALADAALVLHGHTHRADLSYFDGAYGRIPVLGVPSFSMAPGARHPPGAWRMIEIDTVALRATVTEYAISTDGNVTPRTPFAIALPCPPPGDRPN